MIGVLPKNKGATGPEKRAASCSVAEGSSMTELKNTLSVMLLDICEEQGSSGETTSVQRFLHYIFVANPLPVKCPSLPRLIRLCLTASRVQLDIHPLHH